MSCRSNCECHLQSAPDEPIVTTELEMCNFLVLKLSVRIICQSVTNNPLLSSSQLMPSLCTNDPYLNVKTYRLELEHICFSLSGCSLQRVIVLNYAVVRCSAFPPGQCMT